MPSCKAWTSQHAAGAIWRTILVSNISPSYSAGTHPQEKCAISTSGMLGYPLRGLNKW